MSADESSRSRSPTISPRRRYAAARTLKIMSGRRALLEVKEEPAPECPASEPAGLSEMPQDDSVPAPGTALLQPKEQLDPVDPLGARTADGEEVCQAPEAQPTPATPTVADSTGQSGLSEQPTVAPARFPMAAQPEAPRRRRGNRGGINVVFWNHFHLLKRNWPW